MSCSYKEHSYHLKKNNIISVVFPVRFYTSQLYRLTAYKTNYHFQVSEYESSKVPFTNPSFWTASDRGETLALTESGLLNSEALYVVVEKGYSAANLGNGFPFIASYYLDVSNSKTMFQRAPNAWTILPNHISLKYMFSNTPFFYAVSQTTDGGVSTATISRVCLEDTGSDDVYSKERYKSYVQLEWQCVNTDMGARVVYTILEKVVVSKISVNLANAVGGEKGDDVLIGLFYHQNSKTYALCPYLVKDMNKDFDTILPKDDKSKRCNHGINKAKVAGTKTKKPIGYYILIVV